MKTHKASYSFPLDCNPTTSIQCHKIKIYFNQMIHLFQSLWQFKEIVSRRISLYLLKYLARTDNTVVTLLKKNPKRVKFKWEELRLEILVKRAVVFFNLQSFNSQHFTGISEKLMNYDFWSLFLKTTLNKFIILSIYIPDLNIQEK